MPPRTRNANASGSDSDAAEERKEINLPQARQEDERAIRIKADKDMAVILNLIPKLQDVEFHEWERALSQVAFRYRWPRFIMDLSRPIIPPEELSAKERCDSENAYVAITNKVNGHAVCDTLDDVDLGDARGAFKAVHDYFFRPTAAGKQIASKRFHSMTMANTDTNIGQFMAMVSRNAKVVVSNGTVLNDDDILCVMLTGLLPEFDSIKLIIEQQADMTVLRAKRDLQDFADSRGLTLLTKGGNAAKRDKVYHIKDHGKNHEYPPIVPGVRGPYGKPWRGDKRDCQRFMYNGCTRKDCQFFHPTKRSLTRKPRVTEEKSPSAPNNPPDTSSQCLYCGDSTHFMVKCPLISNRSEAQAPESNSTKPEGAADYVFFGQGNQESQHVKLSPSNRIQRCGLLKSWTRWSLTTMLLICSLIASGASQTSDITLRLSTPMTLSTRLEYVSATFITVGVMAMILHLAVGVEPAQVQASLYFSGGNVDSESEEDAASDGVELDQKDYEWCFDSGTNRFVTNDKYDFVHGTTTRVKVVVSVGSGTTTATMSGTVLIKSLDHDVILECRDVLLLPNCSKKLMPASKFLDKGCRIHMDKDGVKLKSPDHGTILSGRKIDGLYHYKCRTVSREGIGNPKLQCVETFFGLPATSGNRRTVNESSYEFGKRLLECHWAYGHLHFTKLRKLLGLAKGDDPDCAACTIAKSRTKSLAKNKFVRSERVNHRKHVDIGFTRNSTYCFQLCIDDFTREGFLDVLNSKADALESFIKMQRAHDNNYAPYSLAIIRTDSEPLYMSDEWDRYCTQRGYQREFSSRYRHDQNGVVERAMQTIGVSFRCMMIQGNAPESDIPDCLRHANVIRNNSPTKANNGWSPYEKAVGKKLPLNKRLMRGPLFCLVFAHVYEEEPARYKHAPRGIACVYLGYDPINNAYLVKEWVSGKRYFTADLDFHPTKFPYRANPTRMSQFLHQYDDIAPHVLSPQNVVRTPPEATEEKEEVSNDRRPVRKTQLSDQAIRNIPDVDVPPSVNYADCESYFIHNFGPDPESWEEAMNSRYANEWILAKLTEQNSFKHHNVLQLVPRSAARGKKIFKPRVVFKIKVNPPSLQHPHGSIEKFRYRLTIAAFTKALKQGIDYEEKYASTVRWNSIKVLMAIACHKDYDINLFDISTFFLHGVLPNTTEIFMEQPEGWEEEDKPKADYIYQVKGNMYGLPQASHIAQCELKKALKHKNVFRPTKSDDCIHVAADHTTGYSALGAHVDDLVAVGDAAGLRKIRSSLSQRFTITEQLNPSIITGVQIDRDRKKKWLKLHQTAYTNELLEKYNMSDCNGADTPMDPGTARTLMLLPKGNDPTIIKQYQTLIGGMIWLMKTRPDMYFTISLLSRFLKDASQEHLNLARGRPLRFLKKTHNFGIVFLSGSGEWVVTGASDSDLAGCLNTARSTLGYYASIGKYGAVLANCGLERKVCTSTGQAETYAMQSLMKDVEWLRRFLIELGFPMSAPTRLQVDNAGVLQQSTKVINHTAAKHYRIAQAYIRQACESWATLVKCGSEENGSDIFTKALHSPLFVRHQLTIMGPQTPPSGEP